MNSAIVLKEIEQFMDAAWDGDAGGICAFLGKYPDAVARAGKFRIRGAQP
jgi:hypothetical protein